MTHLYVIVRRRVLVATPVVSGRRFASVVLTSILPAAVVDSLQTLAAAAAAATAPGNRKSRVHIH